MLSFSDPDGTPLALVGVPDAGDGWSNGPVPAEYALCGFNGVTLLLERAEETAAILTDVLEFREIARDGPMIRFVSAGDKGNVVDIRATNDFARGHQGRGSIHHVAFRAADDKQQAAMAEILIRGSKVHPTEQKNRKYFRSIYFREPGGVLFEIATDVPGFTVDEQVEQLGQNLKLPKFLESRREELARSLPVLMDAAHKTSLNAEGE
jgi:glyoxalase family protein